MSRDVLRENYDTWLDICPSAALADDTCLERTVPVNFDGFQVDLEVTNRAAQNYVRLRSSVSKDDRLYGFTTDECVSFQLVVPPHVPAETSLIPAALAEVGAQLAHNNADEHVRDLGTILIDAAGIEPYFMYPSRRKKIIGFASDSEPMASLAENIYCHISDPTCVITQYPLLYGAGYDDDGQPFVIRLGYAKFEEGDRIHGEFEIAVDKRNNTLQIATGGRAGVFTAVDSLHGASAYPQLVDPVAAVSETDMANAALTRLLDGNQPPLEIELGEHEAIARMSDLFRAVRQVDIDPANLFLQ